MGCLNASNHLFHNHKVTFLCSEISDEECNFPFWHTKLGDNWPLAGVPDVKTAPKFVMSIKKMQDGESSFKPGKRYKSKPFFCFMTKQINIRNKLVKNI